MGTKAEPWLDWGARFKRAIQAKENSLAKVAAKLDMAESSLRSWTNGTRAINLLDFFRLCDAADVDPAKVLFGQPVLTPELRASLKQLSQTLDESTAAPVDKSASRTRIKTP